MSTENKHLEQMKQAKHIADTYAKSIGKNDIKEVIEPIVKGLNSNDTVQIDIATKLARGTVEELTTLILKQEIFTTSDAGYMEFVNRFSDGVVKEGNGKLYDFNHLSSHDSYDPTEFIPTAVSGTNVSEFQIQMYSKNAGGQNQLNQAQAYQFRKPLVIIESNWIPYFKSGKLTQFIAQLQAQIDRSWKIYLFDKIARKISGLDCKKKITGVGANAYECWSDEILPEIRKMLTLSEEYCYDKQGEYAELSTVSELMIFAHPKTIQALQSGIKAQLFNAKFLDLKGLVDAENFIDMGREITIDHTNPDTKVRVMPNANYYIPENKIIVLSKKALKHFSQIDRVASTYYGRNMATEIVLHKWGAMDFLPWGQCFVYTNNNLNKLP